MAEVLLFVTDEVRPDDMYQDGDVVCAFDSSRIHCAHAQHIGHLKHYGFNTDGLRPESMASRLRNLYYTFKFVRVSPTEIKRITLADGSEEIIGATPNAKGEYMDVPLFVTNRKKAPNHEIFGTEGAEYWYGGEIHRDEGSVNAMWSQIEADTLLRKADHGRWPVTPAEKRKFLALPTQDFTSATRANLEAVEIDFDDKQPEYDYEAGKGDRVARKRRSHIADWRDRVPSVADVLNEEVEVDLRESLSDIQVAQFSAKPRKNIWSVRDGLSDGSLFEARP